MSTTAKSALLLTGCVLTASCTHMPLFPLPQVLESQRAQVLVYRSPSMAAGMVQLTVGIDGRAFAYLSNSEYVLADLAPGERQLFVRARTGIPTVYPLKLTAGQRTCLQTTADPEIFRQAFAGGAVLRTEGYAFYILPIPCPNAQQLAKLAQAAVSYSTQ